RLEGRLRHTDRRGGNSEPRDRKRRGPVHLSAADDAAEQVAPGNAGALEVERARVEPSEPERRERGSEAGTGGGSRDQEPDGSGGGDGWNQNAAGVGPVIDERQGAVEDPVAARGDGGDPRAERDRADDLAARHRRKQAIALLSGTGAPYGMQRGEVARDD